MEGALATNFDKQVAWHEEIIRSVGAKFTLCDTLEVWIEAAEQDAKTISAAILQELFYHKRI